MIKGFHCKETEKIFLRRHSRKFSSIQRIALRKLLILDAAGALVDMRVPPANRLEKLSENRKGQCSIRVNSQWRICFRWKSGHDHDVEIVDYHQVTR
jgi:proteic killer suppression protein